MAHAKARIPRARFFFALRPDAAAASALAALAERLAARYGGRPLAGHDIHLTLAFVGMRPIGDAPMLAGFLDGLAYLVPTDPPEIPAGASLSAPRVLDLSRLGTFGHGIVWIGPREEANTAEGACGFAARLAAHLRARLHEAHIDFDDRPLRLHATLVRGAHRFRRDDAGIASEALPVLPDYWTLALGWSDASSTAHRRYRWHPARGVAATP